MISKQTVYEFIKIKENVATEEICSTFRVSESTARRVLRTLEQQKLIRRYHGGASCLKNSLGFWEDKVHARIENNWPQKLSIAREACSLIHDNATVIMLGGTTVYAMCTFLKGRRLKVITNSVIVLSELYKEKDIKLILLGGLFNPNEFEVGGILTNLGMQHIRADYLFMGTMSFNETQGFTTEDLESLELYQTCMSSSYKVYVLADSSKYGGQGTGVVAPPKDVDGLITDNGLGEDVKERLLDKEMNIITSRKI